MLFVKTTRPNISIHAITSEFAGGYSNRGITLSFPNYSSPCARKSRGHVEPKQQSTLSSSVTCILPINLRPDLPIPIRPPNSIFPPKFLQLPHLDPILRLLKRLLARPPCRLSMRRRDGDQDTLFPNWNDTEPVDDRYGSKVMLRLQRARNGK